MPTWAKKLAAHGEAKRKPKVQPGKPIIQETTWAQIRPSSGNDPGEVLPVFFIVDDGVLQVTDETGKPLDGIKPHTLLPSDNAEHLAKLLMMERRGKADPTRFDRRLEYPKWGMA